MSRRVVGLPGSRPSGHPRRPGGGRRRPGPARIRGRSSGSSRSSRTTASTTSPSSTSTSSATTPRCRPTSRLSLDYEEGRTLIDEASRSSDLVLREELLRDARDKLEAFVKAHPDRPEARDALVQMAKLLVERGYLAMLQSEDTQDKAKKDAKMAEARAAYSQAREAYGKAVEALGRGPTRVPRLDAGERPPQSRARRRRGVLPRCDAPARRSATTSWPRPIPPGSAERTKLLDEALEQFEGLYKNYREQWAGLTAQMWQAKCYEEQGRDRRGHRPLQAAPGAQRSAAAGPPAQRRLLLHRRPGEAQGIPAGGRRGRELAPDLQPPRGAPVPRGPGGAARAGQEHRRPDARDLARPSTPRPSAGSSTPLSQVVRYASPFKNEALVLLKKYKPSAAMKAEEIARLNYEDAMERADDAIASHEWDRAIVLLKAAVAQGRPPPRGRQGQPGPVQPGLLLFHEQAILRSRRPGRAPGPALSAGRAVAQGDDDRHAGPGRGLQHVHRDRSDERHRPAGRAGQLHRRDLARSRGRGRRAAEPRPDPLRPGPVRPGDRRVRGGSAASRTSWLEAQTRLGGAHWAKSRVLERRTDPADAAAEAKKASTCSRTH